MESSRIAVGKQVMFTNKEAHKRLTQFYPAVGTVGTILLRSQVIRDGYYIQNDVW